MKKNKLKKLSIFALTTALTVSCLAGCGKKKEEDTEQATITTEAAATMSDADIEFAPTKEGYVINEFSGEWIDESLSNQKMCIRDSGSWFWQVPDVRLRTGICSGTAFQK